LQEGSGGIPTRRRFRGTQNVTTASDPSLNAFGQFKAQLAEKGFMWRPDNEFMYDAFYVALYATVGAGDVANPTGEQISGAIGKLLDGSMPFAVGGADLASASSELITVNKINLEGASGALDFNLQKGEPNVPSCIVWCMNPTPVCALLPSSQSYDVANDSLVGDFDYCDGS
jgi:hypothetical protein